jgi:hypothetical protein
MNFLWFELRRSSYFASETFSYQADNSFFLREIYRIAEGQTPLLILYDLKSSSDNMLNFAHECRTSR